MKRHNSLTRPKRKIPLNLIRSMTKLYCNLQPIAIRNIIFTTTREELALCMLAQSMPSLDNAWAFSISKELARILFVFLNGHYSVVIRYCQSVRGKQRVLKKSLGNKSLQLKSQACVCDCHLLSSPWEKVTCLSSFALYKKNYTFKLQYVIYLFFSSLHYISAILSCIVHVRYRTCAKNTKLDIKKIFYCSRTNCVL